jgi:N-methylhydantoinase B
MVTVVLAPGQGISGRTCGGGGYGPPAERAPAAVARDVAEGKVSPDRAREVYRVALRDGAVDEAATAELRA